MEKDELILKHNKALNEHVAIYISQKFETREQVSAAFSRAEREWKKYCKKTNSTERLINLKKSAFRERVSIAINKIKENELQNK